MKLDIKSHPHGLVEIGWQSKVGHRYDLERSSDLVNWDNVGTYDGTGGKISAVRSTTNTHSFFRVIESMPQGSEPYTWTVTYLDGSKVEVHWNPFGDPVPTGQYQIQRNGILIGVVTGDSDYFVDSNVQSGQTYRYTVGYYS